MQKNRLYKILNVAMPALIVLVAFFISKTALAQSPDLGLDRLQTGGLNLVGGDIRVIIGRIVQVFLSIVGIVFLVLIIYSGWLWMSSAGDPNKINTAKKNLINAVIGLVIILSSFGITQFIISSLQRATSGGFEGTSTGSISPGLIGSLGAGIVGNHVPGRGQLVPRNTKIAIIFKEAMDEKIIINDSNNDGIFGNLNDQVNKASIKLVKTNTLIENNNNINNISDTDLVTMFGSFTTDRKSFVFRPEELLGNANETVSYTAFLTDNLKKADGTNAFAGSFSSGYAWEFKVEPNVDNTPPTITSVIPAQGVNPRNTIVQINFSEPLDPTSSSGDYLAGGGFQNITIRQGATTLTGSYKINSSFKTIEFVTDSLCGVNSCGGDVYCLPGGAVGANALNILVKTATVGSLPPASAGFPYDGVVDLAGNSLDGNGDSVAEGPTSQSGKSPYLWVGGDRAIQGDDVAWSFETSNDIDLVPPKVETITPGINGSNIALDQPVELRFSKLMSAYTLNNQNLTITHNVTDPNYAFWWYVDTDVLDASNNVVISSATPAKTKAIIKHADFYPSPDPPAGQSMFYPGADSKIQDLRQNCFVPSAGPSCVPTTAQPYCCNGALSSTKCSYLP